MLPVDANASEEETAMADNRPDIFISASSDDLRTVRKLVSDAVLEIDCHPIEQSTFPPDYRTVEKMLRGKIEKCQALIHIAGRRYGAEPDPAQLPPGVERRSYTQMEYHIARELQEKLGDENFRVYTFVCAEDFLYDPSPGAEEPEAEKKQELQRRHRATLTARGSAVYERAKDPDKLQNRILALPEQVLLRRKKEKEVAAQMRRMWWLGIGATAVLLLAGLVVAAFSVWHIEHFKPNPEAIRTELRRQIEEKANADLAKEKAGNDNWQVEDQIRKDEKLTQAKVDELIEFLKATDSTQADPVFLEAQRILQKKGADDALAYLASQQQGLLDQAGQMKDEAEKQIERKLQPLLLQAQVMETQQRWDAAVEVLKKVVAAAPDWWDAQNELGTLFQTLGRYEEAEAPLRKCVELAGAGSKQAASLCSLAELLCATNRQAEAEPMLRRALAIDEKNFGSDHPTVAIDLNNLAGVLLATNRLAEAEPLYRKALTVDEKNLGSDHPTVAIFLNNLAELLGVTNRLAEAEPMLRRALAINEKSFGPDHPNVALNLNNLSLLLSATNRLAEAEPLYRRALAINEKSFGPNHPKVACELNNLSLLLSATNRLAEAEPLYRRALAIDEKSFGPDHPNVANDLNNLALLLYTTNRQGEAEPLYRRALAIDEKSFGPDYPDVARDLCNLGELLRVTNRLAEGEPLFRRALAIDEKSYGPNHPNVAIRLNNLAALLRTTNRLTEAEPLFRRAVSILCLSYRQTGHPGPNLSTCVANYIIFCRHLKVSDTEVDQRLEEIRAQSGLDPELFSRLVQPIFHPKSVHYQVTITEVLPGGQGEALQLRAGDIITSYAGTAVFRVDQFIDLISKTHGQDIPLEIKRGDEVLHLKAKEGKLMMKIGNHPGVETVSPK